MLYQGVMTSLTSSLIKPLPFGAAAFVRVRGSVVATANVGSDVARLHGAATATIGTANLAVRSNAKEQNMETQNTNATTETAANPVAALMTAAQVKLTNELHAAIFGYADRMADIAGNGAPLRYIASLCVANVAEPELLKSRGKGEVRVARMTYAKNIFGDRNTFRYFQLAGDYFGKFGDDCQTAVSIMGKDAEGNALTAGFQQAERAADLLVAMMAARGIHTMRLLAEHFGRETSKPKGSKAKDETKPSEGTSAAEVTKEAADGADMTATAKTMSATQRLAVILPMIAAGGFSEAEYQALAAAIVAAKPETQEQREDAKIAEGMAA